MTFALDLEAVGSLYADVSNDGETPWFGDSPARSIDELVNQFTSAIISTTSVIPAHDILVYPLVYESDPDGVLIVVRGEFHKPGLAGTPADWDDYATREMLHGELTLEQVAEVLQAVVDEANRILESA